MLSMTSGLGQQTTGRHLNIRCLIQCTNTMPIQGKSQFLEVLSAYSNLYLHLFEPFPPSTFQYCDIRILASLTEVKACHHKKT